MNIKNKIQTAAIILFLTSSCQTKPLNKPDDSVKATSQYQKTTNKPLANKKIDSTGNINSKDTDKPLANKKIDSTGNINSKDTDSSNIIPAQNINKGIMPDINNASKKAQLLLNALTQNNPEAATDFFFPKEPFLILKDSKNPARYHSQLLRWYKEDIKSESKRFKKGNWKVTKITAGHCKWKNPGSEANKIAYWSCINNKVTASNSTTKRHFKIHALINWGSEWYVTHLGNIR